MSHAEIVANLQRKVAEVAKEQCLTKAEASALLEMAYHMAGVRPRVLN